MALNAPVSPARHRRTTAASSASWWTYTAGSEKLAGASSSGRRRADVIVRDGTMSSGLEEGPITARGMIWALRFTFNTSNGVHVLAVAGRLAGANAADFEATLEDAALKAGRRLIVDLSGADYLSSSALAVLEAAA